MSDLFIKTNNHEYELKYFFDMPKKWRKEFDYVEECDYYSPRFFRYKKVWYDSNEFMYIDPLEFSDHPFKDWDGYRSDSFFSGVLIRFAKDDYDSVIVATYFS